jgi:Permuted papain-like amidase enzyme, YaeF/YiiX, C92 family
MRAHAKAMAIALAIVCTLWSALPAQAAKDRPHSVVRRVVLAWSGEPDLDLHMIGPVSREGIFHISPRNLRAGYGALFESDAAPGRSSETITIRDQAPGVCQFYVHDYTDRDSTSSNALSSSGASLSVYFGDTLESTFGVPAERGGNLWTAFSITGDTLTPVGNMTYERDPDKVGWKLESALIPGDILLGSIPDSLVPGKWSHVAIYAGDGKIIEAPSESEDVVERTTSDWEYPAMTWVTYLRVTTADSRVRQRAIEFALEQERKGCPYDIRFYTKQRNGNSWYCSELVWAAYLNASNDRIDLGESPSWLGVYPWQIDHNHNVALIGGHYEQKPTRSLRVVFLAIKTFYTHMTGWVGVVWHRLF